MPKTINPTNWKIIQEYNYISREDLESKINLAHTTFNKWKHTSIKYRKKLFLKLADLMNERKDELAKLDTLEMWMLYSWALWDISKTIDWIRYTANHAKKWLKSKKFNKEWLSWKIVYKPIWVIYSISPWNFPFNQVFRNATANILAWNTVISKHASNVPQCARATEQLFIDAWFPIWVYQNIEISAKDSEYIISHKYIKWTNITWWEFAGREIWKLAWYNLKPSILELWWNDPFILLDTNNLEKIVDLAIKWRMTSCWQKCNSSKRMIILKEYYDEFCELFTKKVNKLIIWDPFEKDTQIWPLAKKDLISELDNIVKKSIELWAKITTNKLDINYLKSKNIENWNYYAPTVLVNITEDMPIFTEETFWPAIWIIKADNYEDAIRIANNSKYWLTACVVSDSKKTFEKANYDLDFWSVFWNKIPTSYPFLPYWWIKESWYWKELWKRWIRNFTNECVIVY